MPGGPRIRQNGQFGTVTDNPLLIGAGTFNSAELADMQAVTAAHATVTLDPLKEFGDPEIVVVTVHTPAATVATITRGAYGTSARQHPQGTLWVHAALDEDFTEVLTSGTRPLDPYIGQPIFETDTDKFVARNAANSAWVDAVPLGAWVPYTPVNLNVTVGGGTEAARFTRFGRTIHFEYQLQWGTGTAFTGTVEIGLPVPATTSPITVSSNINGQCVDASATDYVLNCLKISGLRARPVANGQSVTATAPFIWVSGDFLLVAGTYEAAS